MNGPTSLLFDLVVRVAPADRRVWLTAMRAEFEFVPPAQRLRFAGGCLAAAVVWRVWTPQGVRTLARGGLLTASALLALLVTAHMLLGTFGQLTPLMAAFALAYAGGAQATRRWGLRGTAAFALGGLFLNSVFVAAWASGFVRPPEPVFLRAFSIEVFLTLAAFLMTAAAAQVLARRLERSA